MREGCWEGPVMEPDPPPPNPHIYTEFTIPGEPLLYSLRYPIGERTREINYFRNKAYYSPLRCLFKRARTRREPMVVFVRFYVTPIPGADVKSRAVGSEKVPAAQSWELMDYTLSFLEILHNSLLQNYRQIVKIDAEKFYSKHPRTVFKFMSYDAYEAIQHDHTLYSETKGVCSTWEKRLVQSKLKGSSPSRQPRPKLPDVRGTIQRAVAYHSALRDAQSPPRPYRRKTPKTSSAALLQAGRRQFRKVPDRRAKRRSLER